jgi:hypothetical protein
MSLFIEKYYPLIASIILSSLSFTYGDIFCFDYVNFYNTSLSIFSILIGFLLTVSTIINTLDNEAIDFIKKSEKFYLFLCYLKKSINTSIYSLLIIIFFILLNKSFDKVIDYINTFLVYQITLALLNCFRFIKIFIKIIIR